MRTRTSAYYIKIYFGMRCGCHSHYAPLVVRATGKSHHCTHCFPCTHLSHPIPSHTRPGELNTIPPRSLCTRLPVRDRDRDLASKLSPKPRERVSLPFGRALAVVDGCGRDWGRFSIALHFRVVASVRVLRVAAWGA